MAKVRELLEKRQEREAERDRVFTAASKIVMERFTPEQQKEITDAFENEELKPSEFTGIPGQFVDALINEANTNPFINKTLR